jgi:1D-myo-inositol 3-kinase
LTERVAESSSIDYLVVGHVCLDLDASDERGESAALGGSATYASLTARGLGQRVGVLTSAGFDPEIVDVLVGPENLLRAETPVRVARLPARETTTHVTSYGRKGRRQQIRALAKTLRPEHVLPEWRGAPIVHLAPIAREVAPELAAAFPDALLGVTPQGWMRAWDAEGRVGPTVWEGAEAVLARADVVILSEEDVPKRSLIARYAEQARLLIVTEHRRGAVVHERGAKPWRSDAFRPVRELDPMGAGDVFAAGFLVEYRRSGDPRQSADYANCVASFSLEAPAWQGLPTAEQVEERLASRARVMSDG